MNTDDYKEMALCLTTDELTEAVEAVDPDWVAHFAGDIDRAVGCYIEYSPEFQSEVARIMDEREAV